MKVGKSTITALVTMSLSWGGGAVASARPTIGNRVPLVEKGSEVVGNPLVHFTKPEIMNTDQGGLYKFDDARTGKKYAYFIDKQGSVSEGAVKGKVVAHLRKGLVGS